MLFVLVSITGWAQDISSARASADDYIKLLNAQGIFAYSLDLSKLEKDKYLIAPVVQVFLYKPTPFAIPPPMEGTRSHSCGCV